MTKLLTLILAFIAVSLVSSCEFQRMLMDEEDKLPRMEVFTYVGLASKSPLSQPVAHYCLFDAKGVTCDSPMDLLRFDMYVESYDINQAFTIDVILPTDDVEYMQHFDPKYRPTVVKWPQNATALPIAWETVGRIPTSDNGRGPGGYFTVAVATWCPKAGQMGWAEKYEVKHWWEGSFFNWDTDDPHFIQPEITIILTDEAGRKAVKKLPLWVNIGNCQTCAPAV